MSLRDLFGGVAPQYKLPAALGSTGQALTVAAGSLLTLTWAAAGGGGAQVIDSGTFVLNGAGGGTGSTTVTYVAYANGNLITVCMTQSVGSSLSFTAINQFLQSATNPFQGYAPTHTAGGAMQFKNPDLVVQRGVAVWEVTTNGNLSIVPFNYSEPPTSVDIMPATIQWQR
jgi:hypothetical protein